MRSQLGPKGDKLSANKNKKKNRSEKKQKECRTEGGKSSPRRALDLRMVL